MRWLAILTALRGLFTLDRYYHFHQELLPTELLMTILVTREGIPFPGLVALIMEISLEALREAVYASPNFWTNHQYSGSSGAGTGSVSAGLASPGMVIVVALTAIAFLCYSYTTLSNTIRILRFPLCCWQPPLDDRYYRRIFHFDLSFVFTAFLWYPLSGPLAPLSFDNLKIP